MGNLKWAPTVPKGKPLCIGEIAIEGVNADSIVAGAFVTDEAGQLWQLWYDGDISGSGAVCEAVVTRRPCAHLHRSEEESSRLERDDTQEMTTLCDEQDVRKDVYLEERLRFLSCSPPLASRRWCAVHESGPGCTPAPEHFECRRATESQPSPQPGFVLLCDEDRSGALHCEPGFAAPSERASPLDAGEPSW